MPETTIYAVKNELSGKPDVAYTKEALAAIAPLMADEGLIKWLEESGESEEESYKIKLGETKVGTITRMILMGSPKPSAPKREEEKKPQILPGASMVLKTPEITT